MVWEFSPFVGADDGDSPPSGDAQLACLRIRFIMISTIMLMMMVLTMTLMSVDSNFYLAQQVQVASIIDRAHHC